MIGDRKKGVIIFSLSIFDTIPCSFLVFVISDSNDEIWAEAASLYFFLKSAANG